MTRMQRVSAPVATTVRMSKRSPARLSSSGATVHITHSEFVGSVVSTGTGFNGASYSIQPGLTALFPWLAPIANRYESYKLRSLRFRYVPQVPTTTAGLVMLVVDFDANDPSPTTEGELLNMNDCAQSPVWKDVGFTANLSVGDKLPSRYVRNGTVGDTDIKTYDVGNFFFATQGVAAGTIGLLYVDYAIDLFTPQINIGGFSTYACTISSTGGTSSTTLLTTNVVTGSAPFTITDAKTLTFDTSWTGILSMYLVGTGVATLTPAHTGTTATTTALMSSFNDSGTTKVSCIYSVSATVGQKLVFNCTNVTTVTKLLCWFAPSPIAYLSPTMLAPVKSPLCCSSSPIEVNDEKPTVLTASTLRMLDEFRRKNEISINNKTQ